MGHLVASTRPTSTSHARSVFSHSGTLSLVRSSASGSGPLLVEPPECATPYHACWACPRPCRRRAASPEGNPVSPGNSEVPLHATAPFGHLLEDKIRGR